MPKRCVYGTCKSDSRYPQRLEGGVVFYAFPKPKTQEERCLLWIKLCGRPHSQLNPSKINKNSFVCSKHFVNGRLTPEHPNPVAALPTADQRREYHGGCRKPPTKRTRCDEQDAASACNLGATPRPRHAELNCAQASGKDVQLLLVSKEEDPPEQQEWSPSLDQEDPPELPHIKEEQEEVWTSQEGEQLQGLEEADIIKFTFSPVPVKSEEDDEEKPLPPLLHQKHAEQIKTEADGEACGGSEPAWNFAPDTHNKASHSSESETDDSRDWEETREPQSGLSPLQNNEKPLSDMETNTEKTLISTYEFATSFSHKGHLQKENGIQTGVKSFSCSVCGKTYQRKNSLTTHMRLHSEEKSFSCSVCKNTFQQRGLVMTHMRVHTGEKPFSCSVCGRSFSQSGTLTSHLRVHTGEKPFICTVCKRSFGDKRTLSRHMRIHTGEKPFRCSVCGKGFAHGGNMRRHLSVHTEEKPLSCSVCGKGFGDRGNLRRHMRIHTGEKLFSCSVCCKGFGDRKTLRQHMTVHTGQTL